MKKMLQPVWSVVLTAILTLLGHIPQAATFQKLYETTLNLELDKPFYAIIPCVKLKGKLQKHNL